MAEQEHNIHSFPNLPRTPNQQREVKEVSFDILQSKLDAMTKGLTSMHKRFKKLEQVNEALTRFNESFGSFLFGMAVNDSVVQWPGAPTAELYQALRERPKIHSTLSKEPQNIEETNVHTANLTPTRIINKKRKMEVQEQPLQTKKRFVTNINVRKIIEGLPLEYRDQTERTKDMKEVLRKLMGHPNGLTIKDLALEAKLPHYRVTACVGALIRSKDAVMKEVKGSYAHCLLNPERYRSTI